MSGNFSLAVCSESMISLHVLASLCLLPPQQSCSTRLVSSGERLFPGCDLPPSFCPYVFCTSTFLVYHPWPPPSSWAMYNYLAVAYIHVTFLLCLVSWVFSPLPCALSGMYSIPVFPLVQLCSAHFCSSLLESLCKLSNLTYSGWELSWTGWDLSYLTWWIETHGLRGQLGTQNTLSPNTYAALSTTELG